MNSGNSNARLLLAACLMLGLCASGARAQKPISFSRQALPLLKKECGSCHGGPNPASGFSIDTRELLLKGGRRGAAILPGKGAQSMLVRYMTGDLQPKMPPNGAIDMERIALIRRWIDEGAKIDSMQAFEAKQKPAPASAAKLSVASNQPAPVTALAFSPDGKYLAAGGYRAVRLLDPATGNVVKVVPGAADQVQAVAWSSDGKFLAAGGGVPGERGEIVLFDTQTWKPLRKLIGHTEVVYALAWKPNAPELASGSLDKQVIVWDALSGKAARVLKDHADAVFAVAYSPDGKLLATGSADRSVKLIQTADWKRVAVLNAHQDTVTRVAFNHDSTLLATAGADKTVRFWQVKIGAMENPQHTQGEGDIINDCAFSPDGSLFAWGASNRVVKVFKGDGSEQRREMKEPTDWVYSVAIGRDNRTLAAGTQDGKVLFWDAQEGKLLRTVALLPRGAKVVVASESGNGK